MLSALEKKYFEIWFNVHIGLLNAKLRTRVEAYTHTQRNSNWRKKNQWEKRCVCVCACQKNEMTETFGLNVHEQSRFKSTKFFSKNACKAHMQC